MAKSLDIQVGGNHYKGLKMQPAELIAELGLDFFSGNVLKYVSRYKNKGGVEDLRKAEHYVMLKMDLLPEEKSVREDELYAALATLGEYCIVNELSEKVYIILRDLLRNDLKGVQFHINDLIEREYGNKDD